MFEKSKFLNKFNKNIPKVNVTIIDNNKGLPDFKKITVPDLKQYLVNGYDEIRQVKQENEMLIEKIDDALKYKDLYDTTLIVLEEFKKRDGENQSKFREIDKKRSLEREEINKLKEKVNTYMIIEKELIKREEKIEAEINRAEKIAKSLIKEKIIKEINNLKGNVSKRKLCNLIKNMEV